MLPPDPESRMQMPPPEAPNQEPSVLDYVKARLMPWRGAAPSIPAAPVEAEPGEQAVAEAEGLPQPEAGQAGRPWPWRSLASLAFALAGQLAFEPPDRSLVQGLILYGLALLLLGWSLWRGEWRLAELPPDAEGAPQPLTARRNELILGGLLALAAFLTFGGNRFNYFNFYIWLLAILSTASALWVRSPGGQPLWVRLRRAVSRPGWQVLVSRWTLLVVLCFGIGAFYRFYRLESTPPEMVSDHAEKLLDVYDVLHGQTSIFFPRNTGREAFQMYLTAAVILIFNTGYSFLSLKIGTALAGLLTIPYIYLLGKEMGSRRIGLIAMLFAGMAYWPNVISRAALRFTLYPFFAAPTLFYLLRGLRTRNRNDFILSGVFLGLGLHGYSTFRIVPFVVVIAVVIYLLHAQASGARRQTILNLLVLVIISALVFLPLLRYTLENPEMVAYRALTRVGDAERDLPGSPVTIFFLNLWRAVTMFAWDNGQIWVHSVTGRPALDVVSAALFYLGVALAGVRYLRRRHWLDLFLILAVPLLMLPSILSLAFPDENPSLNRTGAALIPVFLLTAAALDGLIAAVQRGWPGAPGRRLAWGLAIFLAGWSAIQNYDLVFVQYQQAYQLSAWNTTEMGRILEDFAGSIGAPDTAWVVAYPYWVDTRLVGINAGFPTRDTAIWPDQIAGTLEQPGPKLFLVNPSDQQGQAVLRQLYPQGFLQPYDSAVEGKDFLIFLAPPAEAAAPVGAPAAPPQALQPYP
jgi:4-amino-4-deoxy-L-arabinose transferase-like glycosyltransferase